MDAKIQKEQDWRMIYDITLADILIEKGIITEEEFKAKVATNTEVYVKTIIEKKMKSGYSINK